MARTENDARTNVDVHMASCLEDYAAERLEPPRDEAVEAHLLVCDDCFAAYVALLVRRD
jgi:anti-sigma factor RsiW